MFGWLRELLEIRLDYKEKKLRLKEESERTACNSCEVLKVSLERANYEKDRLLNKILKPEPDQVEIPASEPQAVKRHVPWAVRQQILESEDRQKAKAMAEFKRSLSGEKSTTESLERGLNINQQEAEADETTI